MAKSPLRTVWWWECHYPHVILGDKESQVSCGSTNFNNLARHETPWCVIVKKHSKDCPFPKTWGGYNGDVSRKFLKDWIEECRRIDIAKSQVSRWNKNVVDKMMRESPKKTLEYLKRVDEICQTQNAPNISHM